MERLNQCEWTTVSCFIPANDCNEKTDMILGALPVPVEENDSTLSSIDCIARNDGEEVETQEEFCDIQELCTLLLDDSEGLKLFGMNWQKIEMIAILETIVRSNYNCIKAGKRLGICEKTLFNKLRMYKRRYYRGEL